MGKPIRRITKKPIKNPRSWMAAVTLFGDILGWGVTFSLIWVLSFIIPGIQLEFYPEYLLAFTLFIIFSTIQNQYKLSGLSPVNEIRQMFFVVTTTILLTMLVTLLITLNPQPRILIFGFLWLLLLFTVLFFRWMLRILARKFKLWGEPICLIANSVRVRSLIDYFSQRSRLGMIPVCVASLDGLVENHAMNEVPIISVDELLQTPVENLDDQDIKTVVIDSSVFSNVVSTEIMQKLFSVFQRVVFLTDLEGFGGGLGGAYLEVHDFEGLIGLEAQRRSLSPAKSLVKRFIDIFGSLTMGLLTMPIWILAIIAIKLDSKGSIFYSQERLGKEGKSFNIYKFRTMVTDAEKELEKYLAENPSARKEWEQNQKLKTDPRITRPGKWIRRFSIDEFPQLLNILKGEMSLVGPRPIVEEEIRHYGDHFDIFSDLKPGLTGMWQVSGRNLASYQERVRFDVYYARNWSFWLDLYILARTFWVVVSQVGAY